LSIVVGVGSKHVVSVGDNPNPISFVWRPNRASWKYKRFDGVALNFQISTDIFE
jgi:hypothetical protein